MEELNPYEEASSSKHSTRSIPRIALSSLVPVLDDHCYGQAEKMGVVQQSDLSFLKVMMVRGRDGKEGDKILASPVIYRMERYNSASTVAKITNLVSQLSHPNIVDILGLGGGESTKRSHFILTSPWDVTLRENLTSIENQQQQDDKQPIVPSRYYLNIRKKNKKRSNKRRLFSSCNLWQHVALPLTRVFCFLHSNNVAFGRLTLDSIVLSSPSFSKSNVMLRDFSQARTSEETTKTDLDLDIFDLGMIFEEMNRVQPFRENSIESRSVISLIETCCHPSNPPSARRVHKRLLEILRFLPTKTLVDTPAAAAPPPPAENRQSPTDVPSEIQLVPKERQQKKKSLSSSIQLDHHYQNKKKSNSRGNQHHISDALTGLRQLTSPYPRRSMTMNSRKTTIVNTNSSQCPTENSSLPSSSEPQSTSSPTSLALSFSSSSSLSPIIVSTRMEEEIEQEKDLPVSTSTVFPQYQSSTTMVEV